MLATLKIPAAVLAVVALSWGGSAQAADFRHIDELAMQIERQARDLHHEADLHARRSPLYPHLHHDVTQIERLADDIHRLVHRGDVFRLRAAARQLDYLVHHVDELIDQMARTGGLDRRDYYHMKREVRQLGNLVHHLLDDLR